MTPPQYQPSMWELMVEASDFRNKDKLLEVVKKMQQPAEADPAEEQMKQLAMASAQADVEKKQSEVAKNAASAQATTAGVQIDAFEAEIDAYQAGLAA